MKLHAIVGAALLLFTVSSAIRAEDHRVTIDIDEQARGTDIPQTFLGLSLETSVLLRESTGEQPYLNAKNKDLIRLFKTLGVKSLRIGGNTADRPTLRVPQEQEIDDLFGFAKASGVRVIYTLRLRDSNPEVVTKSAKYLIEHYNDLIDCLAIGNEPNIYEHQFE